MICRDVLFHFGDATSLRKALRNYHTQETIDEIIANPPEITTYSGRTIYKQTPYTMIIWLPCIPKISAEYGTLSHEIFHAAVAIMQSIGVSLSEESEETYAYLIGFLSKKAFEIINKTTSSACENGRVLVSGNHQPKT